jgi:uncharacterized protein YxjI
MIRTAAAVRPTAAVKAPVRAAAAGPVAAPRAQEAAEGVKGTFTIKKRFWNFFRPTYDVLADGQKVGTIQRKLLSWTPSWTLSDANGQKIGDISQRFFSLGFETTVHDEKGQKAGAIKQDIIRSLVNPTAALRILDGKGQVVAKTDPVWLSFHGRIDLKSPDGQNIGQFSNKWFTLTETNQLTLDQPMDKRLALGFIASQIEVKKQEEAAKRREEEERRREEEARKATS